MKVRASIKKRLQLKNAMPIARLFVAKGTCM